MEPETVLTLARIPMGFAFKIPPLQSNRGPSAADIKDCPEIWKGVVRVVLVNGSSCEIRLEDSLNGKLFARALLNSNDVVVRTPDSSRYFVVRLSSGDGRTMFIGLGFNERSEAFDFNEAVSSRGRYSATAAADDDDDASAPAGDSKDWSLKAPITLKNVSGTTSSTTGGGGALTALKPPPKAARARKR